MYVYIYIGNECSPRELLGTSKAGLPVTEALSKAIGFPDQPFRWVPLTHAQESMISPNVITYSSCVSAGLGGVFTAKWHQKHGMLTCCMCFRCEMFFVFNRWVLGFVLILELHEICWNHWPDEIAYFILLSQGFPHPGWKRHIVRSEKTCIGTAQSYFAVLTVLVVCMFMPLCLRQEFMMHVESTPHPEPSVTETLDPLPLCTAMLERYRQILLAVWAFGSFQSWSRLPWDWNKVLWPKVVSGRVPWVFWIRWHVQKLHPMTSRALDFNSRLEDPKGLENPCIGEEPWGNT